VSHDVRDKRDTLACRMRETRGIPSRVGGRERYLRNTPQSASVQRKHRKVRRSKRVLLSGTQSNRKVVGTLHIQVMDNLTCSILQYTAGYWSVGRREIDAHKL